MLKVTDRPVVGEERTVARLRGGSRRIHYETNFKRDGSRRGGLSVDETYVKVAGKWRYAYRAVDRHSQIIDLLVSTRRDLRAVRRFFATAIRAHGEPVEVITDRAAELRAAIEALMPAAFHNTEQYANNRVECDHSARVINGFSRADAEHPPRPLRTRRRSRPGPGGSWSGTLGQKVTASERNRLAKSWWAALARAAPPKCSLARAESVTRLRDGVVVQNFEWMRHTSHPGRTSVPCPNAAVVIALPEVCRVARRIRAAVS